ncbi:MAG: PilZ domain-containing protein [Oscillospiraceae bacterium]|nr:PilZ domain-containing protein [Oscillospiraceae bacterium]
MSIGDGKGAQEKKISESGLKLGTRLTLAVPGKPPNNAEVSLYSTFELAIDSDNFLISAPMLGAMIYPLSRGDAVVVRYLTPSAFFEADAVVTDRLRKGELQYVKLNSPSPVRRNQRRNDYRVDLILETFVMEPLENNPMKIIKGAERHKAVIRNLSGGGAALYSSFGTEQGKFLHVVMPPDVMGSETILVSQVHWVRKPETDSPYAHHIGVRFIFESAGHKESLIRYTFEQQRKQLKRR